MTPHLERKIMLKKKQQEPTALDQAIDTVLSRMQYVEPESDEYGTLVSRLDKLHSMKIAQKDNRQKVSADALIAAGASILGIILIIGYERVNVVTSKALGFVAKAKI